jgi:arsenical-resistance protein 2
MFVGMTIQFVLLPTLIQGGSIKHSVNFPAQSWYPSLATVYEMVKDVPFVVFYCGSCSGRGPRSAAWLKDYMLSKGKTDKDVEGVGYLEGGIKGWVKADNEYIELMDGYEAEKW